MEKVWKNVTEIQDQSQCRGKSMSQIMSQSHRLRELQHSYQDYFIITERSLRLHHQRQVSPTERSPLQR